MPRSVSVNEPVLPLSEVITGAGLVESDGRVVIVSWWSWLWSRAWFWLMPYGLLAIAWAALLVFRTLRTPGSATRGVLVGGVAFLGALVFSWRKRREVVSMVRSPRPRSVLLCNLFGISGDRAGRTLTPLVGRSSALSRRQIWANPDGLVLFDNRSVVLLRELGVSVVIACTAKGCVRDCTFQSESVELKGFSTGTLPVDLTDGPLRAR